MFRLQITMLFFFILAVSLGLIAFGEEGTLDVGLGQQKNNTDIQSRSNVVQWKNGSPVIENTNGDNNNTEFQDNKAVPLVDFSEPFDTSANSLNYSILIAKEAQLTGSPLMALVKKTIVTLDNNAVVAITPKNINNPNNVKRLEAIVSNEDFEYFFPKRASEYTYQKLLQAIGKFPSFCGDYDDGRNSDVICRKAITTMFAHFTQETGGHSEAWPEAKWRQGLYFIREMGYTENIADGYGLCSEQTWQGQTWACGKFPLGHVNENKNKSYFGRGAKQLSYNYNYGQFSHAIFGDVNVLLNKPELVADTWLNFASAVFFFVYPQSPKPSMLHVVDGSWQPNARDRANGLTPGFGLTTQIINGGIECGGTEEVGQSVNRISYYTNFAKQLNVPIANTEKLGCTNVKSFDDEGAAAMAIYWDQDWSEPNSCKLVSYQTAFSAFNSNDYVKCVDKYFDITIDYNN